MSRRLNAHPLTVWAALAAIATGIGVSVDLTVEGPAGSSATRDLPASDLVEAVVIEVEQQTVELHIPPDSPIWGGATTLCGAASGVLSILGYGSPNCQIGYQPPPIHTVVFTFYVSDQDVRLDFSGQSMVGQVASDGSYGNWHVLDPTTGRSIPWQMNQTGGGPGLWAMAGSTALSNLLAPGAVVRNSSTGPVLRTSGETRAGHPVSGYAYGYSVSGAVQLANGTETGVAIIVEGMARYADQGPFLSDGRIVTVLDNLGGAMLFQNLEPPSDLEAMRDIGGLLSVDEVIRVSAYRGTAAYGDPSGDLFELVRGQTHTTILDARREQVSASMFPAPGPAQGCDCSCAARDTFMRFIELPNAEEDPRAMALTACGLECANRWARRCR
jgi:hypothetical protein